MNILLTCVREREREREGGREAGIFIVHTKCGSMVIGSAQAFVVCNATR